MSKRLLWLMAAAALSGCTIEMPDTYVVAGDGTNVHEQEQTTTETTADNGGDIDR